MLALRNPPRIKRLPEVTILLAATAFLFVSVRAQTTPPATPPPPSTQHHPQHGGAPYHAQQRACLAPCVRNYHPSSRPHPHCRPSSPPSSPAHCPRAGPQPSSPARLRRLLAVAAHGSAARADSHPCRLCGRFQLCAQPHRGSRRRRVPRARSRLAPRAQVSLMRSAPSIPPMSPTASKTQPDGALADYADYLTAQAFLQSNQLPQAETVLNDYDPEIPRQHFRSERPHSPRQSHGAGRRSAGRARRPRSRIARSPSPARPTSSWLSPKPKLWPATPPKPSSYSSTSTSTTRSRSKPALRAASSPPTESSPRCPSSSAAVTPTLSTTPTTSPTPRTNTAPSPASPTSTTPPATPSSSPLPNATGS